MVHPEMELLTSPDQLTKDFLEPVYSTTEKLKARSLGGRQIAKLTKLILDQLREKDIPEFIPGHILKSVNLVNRFTAYKQVHFPSSPVEYEKALKRLKFEEFFVAQLRLNLVKARRHRFSKGVIFDKVGESFNTFYNKY